MRTLLLVPALATLVTVAACNDTQPSTAPAKARAISTPAAQSNGDAPINPARPVPTPTGFTSVTVVESSTISNPGGAVAGQVICPTGTTRISGGYGFIFEGTWSPPPVVTQSVPYGNGWWVRTIVSGNTGATFKVYAVCAS